MTATRIESSVTSLSWIPSEAVTGVNKAIFGTGFTHYDAPPPDRIGDLEALRATDAFRFANHLAAWIDRGEPSYEIWPAYVSPSGWSRIKDRVVDAGALILIIFWSGLATYGLHTLASRMV